MTKVEFKIADFFTGCGGFSLGAKQARFSVRSAFDIDPILTFSHARNFRQTPLAIADLSEISGNRVIETAGCRLDCVIGGPPCQGFSSIGKRDASDPRRSLVHHFFRLVSEVRPRFFVMENVAGLAFRDSRPVLDAGIELLRGKYQVLQPIVFDAADFGAPTSRKRVFVIGVDPSRAKTLDLMDFEDAKCAAPTVQDAIRDLASPKFVGEHSGFDTWRLKGGIRPSTYAAALRSKTGLFTGNQATIHSPSVIKRFQSLRPGTTDKVGRHFRLDWEGLCPTLRAGTGSANGSYQSVRPIHPSEPRVITVREAARLQGFPDSFQFHPTIWHSFRMIGNSVCPIQARAILDVVRTKLV